jgi:hypothetical protein
MVKESALPIVIKRVMTHNALGAIVVKHRYDEIAVSNWILKSLAQEIST